MLHQPQAWLVRYSTAIIAPSIAAALTLILEPVFVTLPLILFLAAVTAAAWLGGLGPGLLATLLGVLLSALISSRPGNPLGADAASRLALFAVLGVGISLLQRVGRRAEERALLDERERLRLTLSSIGDAVIAADTSGAISFMNPSAEQLTGWTEAEAKGRPLGEVFRLLDSRTRTAPPDPLRQVLALGQTVELHNHTLLIRRDGAEMAVDDSGAPIRDAAGKVAGAIFVFRDVTQPQHMQAALRESEERFRTMANSVPVMIWAADANGEDTFVNEQWVDFAGKGAAELLGNGWLDTLHPDDRARVWAEWEACQRERTPIRVEYRVRRHDGEYRWVLSSGAPVFDSGGEFMGYMGGMIDIHDRREGEAALHDSEERLRRLIESAPAAVIAMDPEGRIVLVNEAVEEMFGWARGDLLGQPLKVLLPERFRRGHEGFRRGYFGNPQTRPMGAGRELYGLRKDNTEFPVEIGLSFAAVGDEQLALAFITDISERRAAEAAVRESEERFRTMANSAPVMIWMSNEEGETSFVNESWLEFTGVTLKQALDTVWWDLIHPDDWAAIRVETLSNFAQRQPFELEYRLRSRDEEFCWVVDRGVPRFDAGGQFLGYIGAVADITERRRAEMAQRFLSEASALLAASLDYETTLASVAKLAVPNIADWVAVDVLEDGQMKRVAVAHIDPQKIELANRLLEQYPPDPDSPTGAPAVIRTGRSQVMFEIPDSVIDAVQPDDLREIVRELDLKSSMIVPLVVRGYTLGAISFVSAESGRRFTASDLSVAEAMAARAAIAVDNARLYRDMSRQREHLRVTLASIGDAVIAADTQGRITFMNPVAESLTGWSEPDALGLSIGDVFHIADEATRQTVANPIDRVLKTGYVVGLANHTILVSRDGREIPIDDSGAPIRTQEGDIAGVILVFRDISQRRRTEEELAAQVRQQAAVAELGQLALRGADLQSLMDEATQLVCSTLHMDYCKVLELLPGDGVTDAEMLLRAGVGWNKGLVGKRKVGAQRGSHGGYTLMSSQPVLFEDLASETRFEESLLVEHKVVSGLSVVIGGKDRLWGTLGAHSRERRRFTEDDINFMQAVANALAEAIERDRTEMLLRQSLDRTRDLYEVSRHIGLADSPRDVLEALLGSRTIANASQASIVIFDKPWDEAPPAYGEATVVWQREEDLQEQTGRRFSFEDYGFANVMQRDEPFIVIEAQTDPRINETSRQYLRQIGTRSLILFPLVAGGDWFGHLTIHWQAAQPANDTDARHMKGLVDQAAAAIYNFRLLQAEAAARQRAERADALKMKFLAMISHELRTPLTSIKGFATSLLAEDVEWDAASQHEFIGIINEEANKLGNLIEQLLDLSRLEAGTLGIRREHIFLKDILAATLPPLHLIAGQHRLEVETPSQMPMLFVDPTRIAQVLSNIVNNAANYSPPGSTIRLAITCAEDTVRFDVTDEGSGIPPDERDTVFEPFRQATNRPTREIKGAGLGLAISRGLVEAHGGRIWIDDRAGPGTTVSFTLPAAGEE